MPKTKEIEVDDVSKIRINPDNHSRYDCPPNDSWNFNKCLEVHNDIDLYFSSKLGSTITDWGGRYASFLNDIGIDHQSDNGWWSIYAVNHKNIEAFVSYYSDDPDNSNIVHQYESARDIYSTIKKAGFVNHKHKIVKDAITALNSIK
jgi:hypothetical protein